MSRRGESQIFDLSRRARRVSLSSSRCSAGFFLNVAARVSDIRYGEMARSTAVPHDHLRE